MVSQHERARLVERYKYEPTFVWAKFGVFLAIVGALGIVGINIRVPDDGARDTIQARHHQRPAAGLTAAPNEARHACSEALVASTTSTLFVADGPCVEPTESGARTADAPQLPLELAKAGKKPATPPLPDPASTTQTETIRAAAEPPAEVRQ